MTQNDNGGLGPEGSYYEAVEKKRQEEKRRKQDALFPIEITALYLYWARFSIFGIRVG